MTPISVVIITYNEERNIERCIRSVEKVADEVVVVDSFSVDRTVEIAQSLGAKVVQHAFEGHIEQKNYAITQAKYPHILSLDADEALDNNLVRSILEAKLNWNADGYKMNRLTNYCGKWVRHSGWYPDRKLRLWDSRKGQWGGRNPHDEYKMEKGCIVEWLSGDILHYSYYTVAEHKKQIRKFTDISSKAALEAGKKSYPWSPLMHAVAKFIRLYFIKLGFLDGWVGVQIASFSGWASYLKYSKMRS